MYTTPLGCHARTSQLWGGPPQNNMRARLSLLSFAAVSRVLHLFPSDRWVKLDFSLPPPMDRFVCLPITAVSSPRKYSVPNKRRQQKGARLARALLYLT